MSSELQQILQTLQQQQAQQTQALLQQQTQAFEAILSRLPQGGREPSGMLIDTRGIAKPEQLTSNIANEHGKFVLWRVKLGNYIEAAFPGSANILENIERHSAEEIDQEKFEALLEGKDWMRKMSFQLKAILTSICVEEPLTLVMNTPRADFAGLEAYRKLNDRYDPLGPRAAKSLLQRILGVSISPLHEVRLNVERVERLMDEYRLRTGNPLGEDIRMVVLESLLPEPLKTHVSLNAPRLSSYPLLRDEVVRYAEKVEQDLKASGAAPMELDLVVQKGKGKGKSKGKGKTNGKGIQPKDVCKRCGRPGHWKAECYATKHQDGTELPPSSKGGEKGKHKGKGKGKNKGKNKEKGLHEVSSAQPAQGPVPDGNNVLGALCALTMEPPWRRSSDASTRSPMEPPWRRSSDASTRSPARPSKPMGRQRSSSRSPSRPSRTQARQRSSLPSSHGEPSSTRLQSTTSRVLMGSSSSSSSTWLTSTSSKVSMGSSLLPSSSTGSSTLNSCRAKSSTLPRSLQETVLSSGPTRSASRSPLQRRKKRISLPSSSTKEKTEAKSETIFDDRPPLPRRKVHIDNSGRRTIYNREAETKIEQINSGATVQIRVMSSTLAGIHADKARDGNEEEKAQHKQVCQQLKEQARRASKLMSCRLAADLRAGHPRALCIQKEKSRRRAAQHRKQGAEQRSKAALDRHHRWMTEVESTREKEQTGQGLAGALPGIEEDSRNITEYSNVTLAMKPLSKKELEQHRGDEDDLPAFVPQKWDIPGWLARRMAKKKEWMQKQKKKIKKVKIGRVECRSAAGSAADVEHLGSQQAADSAAQVEQESRPQAAVSAVRPTDQKSDLLASLLAGFSSVEDIEFVVDSGASTTAIPESIAGHIPMEPNHGSKTYTTASKQVLHVLGQRTVPLQFEGGTHKTMTCDVMPIHRPLASVSKIVAKGHKVVFSQEGSFIEQQGSGQRIPLELRDGVYLLKGHVLNTATAQNRPFGRLPC